MTDLGRKDGEVAKKKVMVMDAYQVPSLLGNCVEI